MIRNPASTRSRSPSTAPPGPSTAASAWPPPGLGFLPIYLGPTLMRLPVAGSCCARCCASPRPTASPRSPTSSPPATARARCSPAWSRSSRWSAAMPYIALQLKAVVASVAVRALGRRRRGRRPPSAPTRRCSWRCCWPLFSHPVRHPPHRRHRASRGHGAGGGLRERGQAAAFLIVGAVRHLRPVRRLRRPARPGARLPASARLLTIAGAGYGYADWFAADAAVRPRPSCSCPAVPGGGDRERRRAPPAHARAGCFPLYLLAINLFVLPIALAGRCCRPAGDGDTASCCAAADGRPALAGAAGLSWAACRRRPR